MLQYFWLSLQKEGHLFRDSFACEHSSLKKIDYSYLLLCRGCATAHVCMSQDNLWESVLSSSTMWVTGIEPVHVVLEHS